MEEPVRKGRGRPESTGELRIRKAKEAAAEIRREAAELREILDPDIPARPRGKGVAPPEGLDEIRTSAVPTLRGIIDQELQTVEKIAACSSHLKGTLVKGLRDAAARIAASSDTLVRRAEASVSADSGGIAGSPALETEKLRAELDELRRENVKLRAEIEAQNRRLEDALASRLSAAHLADGPVTRKVQKDRTEKPKLQPSSGSEGDWPPPGPSRPEAAMDTEVADPPNPSRVKPTRDDNTVVPRSTAELTALITRVVSAVLDEREARRPVAAPIKPAPTKPVSGKNPPTASSGKKGGKVAQGKSSGAKTPPTKGKGPCGGAAPIKPKSGGKTAAKIAAAGPPPPPKKDQKAETWSRVVGRRAQREARKAAAPPPPPPSTRQRTGDKRANNGPKGNRAAAPQKRKVPGTEAITVTCPEGTYATVMAEARAKIKLADVGIASVKVKRAQTGALILEVPNQNQGTSGGDAAAGRTAAQMADELAQRMRGIFRDRPEIVVARPLKTAELRIRGLDDATTPGEVAAAVAKKGGCAPAEVTVGALNLAPDGLQSGRIKCPVRAANAVAAAGRLLVGWAAARIEMLPARPLTCHRCMQRGHTRLTCGSTVDRSDLCYRCGGPGHRARDCRKEARCPVCADAGRPAGHRVGGPACAAPAKRGTRAAKRVEKAGEAMVVPAPPPPPPPASTAAEQPKPQRTQPMPRRSTRRKRRADEETSGAESDVTSVSMRSFKSVASASVASDATVASHKRRRAASRPPPPVRGAATEENSPSSLGEGVTGRPSPSHQ